MLTGSGSEEEEDSVNDEASALLEDSPGKDAEAANVKLKYPKSVFFIISNEFCERFSYYGMRTILAIYLKTILKYSDDTATIIYHTFTMFCYFFPLLGAMLADSLLGKFRTIFYLSIVYAIGNVVISVASATGSLNLPAREVSIIGLLLISIGTGGIKPCVSAFGGDQFQLPQQEKQLAQFFSLFYFSINSGSLVSTFLTPVLREDVKCLDQDSCYPLAFGVPAVLMIISVLFFLAGHRLYVMKKPQGNVVLKVCHCIGHALTRKSQLKGEKREHWLDYADDKHDKKMINDVKGALRVLYLYLPLPFFWALFDQQGSRWTFQATRMTGQLGDWSLKPDQMQVINPLLILLFIPIFETCLYPLLAKCNLLKKPLQRLGIGGLLAALSFVVSAIVEMQLEPTYPVLPQPGEAQLRIFNSLDCNASIQLDNVNLIVENMSMKEKIISVSGQKEFKFTFSGCGQTNPSVPQSFEITGGQATSIVINQTSLQQFKKDQIDKSDDGSPTIRIIYSGLDANQTVGLNNKDHTKTFKNLQGTGVTKLFKVEAGKYDVKVKSSKINDIELQVGGVYTLLVSQQGKDIRSKLFTISQPNTVHMLWLIPQYIIITMGEVMFSITGLEFSFTQAPVSMKSVMQAGWLLTVAVGNLIVVIIAEAKFFESQTYEFFLFAGLMIVDMAIFSLMAMGYKYIEHEDEDNGELALEETEVKSGIDNKSFKADE